MASLSSRPPQTGTATVTPRAGWGGGTDQGSAFRGMGRGRGGRGGGDRGRGGRGGARGGRTGSSSISETTPRGFSNSKSDGAPTDGPGPKLPSRRISHQSSTRKPPALNIEPASPVDGHPASASLGSAKSPRRKRSHQPKPTLASSVKPIPIEAAMAALRPQMTRKASSGPPSPHGLVKDAPPHLSAGPSVQTFDIKSNIDTLVERVRAIAMERPNTPGSHIDWAGDDDDTLPDLDDWGVHSTGTLGTTVSEAGMLGLMSPILDDSLKQLPIHDDKSKSPSVNGAALSPKVLPADVADEKSNVPAENGVKHEDNPPKAVESVSERTPQTKTASNGLSSKPSPASTHTPSTIVSSHTTLHPSLPTKPASIEPTKTESPSALPGSNTESKHPATATTSPSVPEPVSADSATKSTTGSARPPRKDLFAPDRPGLEASMHAPKNLSQRKEESEARDGVSSSRNGTSFNPAHGRSRTLGRPAPGPAPTRPFKSGPNTPHTSTMQHARTQSTPPAAPAVRHARQGSRPVIASSAISSIMKTLGGPGTSPRRQPAPPTSSSATSSE